MVKLLARASRTSGRYLALVALTSTLVACGGSGGDTTPVDTDGDGIPDIDDPDADGDGIDENIGALDLDGDGIPNNQDFDADGDGLDDNSAEDRFVDLDGDGLDDVSGLREGPANFPDVTDAAPCGGESGSDARSINAEWNDNCLIRRTTTDGDGQFADSLYAVGVQRIVFCSGFGAAEGDDYRLFADGEYGPLSEAAMQQFQASEPNPISDDGQVGPQSWAKLQAAITRLSQGQLGSDANGNAVVGPDIYGFTEGRCANVPLFEQSGTFDSATQSVTLGGWRLTRNQPNEAQTVPFSIDPPFGRL